MSANDDSEVPNIIAQFVSAEDGETKGPQIELPSNTTVPQLQELINKLLSNEDPLPYSFYVNGEEVMETLICKGSESTISTEKTLEIVYTPQAVFRVHAVTRSCGTLVGHTNSVVCVQFSPDGQRLASGSGDMSVRFWDLTTVTPHRTCTGHRDWVLCIAWSPDSRYLASGCKDGEVKIWDADTGALVKTLRGHRLFVTSLAWEPYSSLSGPEDLGKRLVSASKDGTARIWDVPSGTCVHSLSGHSQGIQCVKWGGDGRIYTGSRDRTINVFDATHGRLIRTLRGHSHWINCMSLSGDYVTRTGPYDHKFEEPESVADAIGKAKKRYTKMASLKSSNGAECGERLVSASDDGTLILWTPGLSAKPVARMTGHQQQVMTVAFSPDGRFIASGSFDKCVKLWDGYTGKFIATFRGHVAPIYQLAWSPDSRMLVSGSKDSTMKLWDIGTRSMAGDLPGHADEVFSVDWSPDGEFVASGSFDRTLKLWRH